MYSYNSYHKIVIGLLLVVWAMYQFSGRTDEIPTYNNGQEKRTGEVVNSLNQGVWTWYYGNGKVQLTGAFDEGNRIGIWKSYDTLGNLLVESTYQNNILNGLFTEYSTSGEIITQYIYRADTIKERLVE